MCNKKYIVDIVHEIFDELQEDVYNSYGLNVTYKLFVKGYSSALIEYKFTDPTVPCSHYYRGMI